MTTLRTGFAALATALLIAGCQGQGNQAADGNAASTAEAIAPPAGTTWETTVTKTPDGGFVMGNPDAPVKLVEYLSITCGHCAEFAKTGFVPLRDTYIKKGTVSFEIRNYVRDPLDVTAALATRCNGPAPYFQMTEQALADQTALFERAQGITEADQARIGQLPPQQQYVELATLFGIDQFARQRGVSSEQLNQCMADKAGLDELIEMQRVANEDIKIPGTPAFLINGNLVPAVGTWDQLEPALKAAGA